jgi:cell division protease FtsH
MTKPYSETTAETIDEEVRKIVLSAYERTKELLRSKLTELETLAQELLEKEILFQSDLEKLIGKRPFEKETTYEAFTKKKPAKEVKAEETPKSETPATEQSTDSEKDPVAAADTEASTETKE